MQKESTSNGGKQDDKIWSERISTVSMDIRRYNHLARAFARASCEWKYIRRMLVTHSSGSHDVRHVANVRQGIVRQARVGHVGAAERATRRKSALPRTSVIIR